MTRCCTLSWATQSLMRAILNVHAGRIWLADSRFPTHGKQVKGNWQLWHLSILSDLKELHQATPHFMTKELDRNQCMHGLPQKFFQGGNIEILFILQVSDDAMQTDVHKTLYPFCPISLCWLNLNSQSFVWNIFYTSVTRNAFSFHEYPICPFFEHFLQVSYNLRIINRQNNTSGENIRKLGTPAKLSSNEK